MSKDENHVDHELLHAQNDLALSPSGVQISAVREGDSLVALSSQKGIDTRMQTGHRRGEEEDEGRDIGGRGMVAFV